MPRLAGFLRLSVPRRSPDRRTAVPRVRRARAVITVTAVATLVIAVGATAAVERHRLGAIDGEYAQRRELLRARQAEAPDRPLVLVAGSSRIVMGFAPEQFPPPTDADGRPVLVFNFSHYGAGPILTGVSLRRLFADGVRPRAVVLELMPAFLARENARLVSSLCTAGDAAAAGRYYANGELYWEYLRGRATGLPGLCRRACGEDPPFPLGPSGGFTALKDDVTPDERAKHTAAQVPHFGRLLRDWTPAPGADRAVRELVAACRRDGVAVRLIVTPEGPANRAMYGPGCRDRVTAYAAGLAKDLDVPLTDARDWLAEEDFADSHHVLKRGAAKFTERLGREVIGPMACLP